MTEQDKTSLPDEKKSLLVRMGKRYGIDERKVLKTLKDTVFKQSNGVEATDEQLTVLLIVAEQYGLNPFINEIYAFPAKSGGIVPVVGVDGWTRIINSQKDYAGVEFVYSDAMVSMSDARSAAHEWIECVIYRKSLEHPVRVREYINEVYRPAHQYPNGQIKLGPWQTHPKRFHRHKSLIQCARLAFGFGGIYDQDEAERMNEIDITPSGAESRSHPPLSIGHDRRLELDATVTNLIARSVQHNDWSPAHQWAVGRLAGEEQSYVLAQLEQAKAEQNQVPVASQTPTNDFPPPSEEQANDPVSTDVQTESIDSTQEPEGEPEAEAEGSQQTNPNAGQTGVVQARPPQPVQSGRHAFPQGLPEDDDCIGF